MKHSLGTTAVLPALALVVASAQAQVAPTTGTTPAQPGAPSIILPGGVEISESFG